MSGDAADPMAAERLAILDRQTGGDPATSTARSTPTPPPQPPSPDADHLIKSKLVQCDRCDAIVAHLIYADAATGTLEDHVRLMYGRIHDLGLPTRVLGPTQERGRHAGYAQLRAVYPKREPARWISEAEFDAIIDAVTSVHCAPAQADALDLLPDPAHSGPGLEVTAAVNARARRRAAALPPEVRRTLGDPDRLTPQTLQALLVPSAAEEARARYRAHHGRGILLCDNTDGRGALHFWYVRPRETPGVLADAPVETRVDVTALLTVYDARTEAILVALRRPESAGEYVLYLRADVRAGDAASGGWTSVSS